MKQEIKEKWVAALRSGEYKQGKGSLRKDDEFCCLGVLCDVYDKEQENSGWKHSPSLVQSSIEVYSYMEEYNGSTYTGLESKVLPQQVKEWADLESENPTIKLTTFVSNYIDSPVSLASLNDDGGSFVEIAKVIEEQF